MSWSATPLAGEVFTADQWLALITELRPICAVKTADDTRTTTTYIADTELSVSIPSAGTYEFAVLLIYNGPTGGTNGRLKVRVNYPAGSITLGHVGGKNNTAVADANMTDVDLGAIYDDTSSPTTDLLFPTVNTTVELTALIEGTLVATAAGTLYIETAQIFASGTTTIRKHSRLTAKFTGL